jgi:hypothetical protein
MFIEVACSFGARVDQTTRSEVLQHETGPKGPAFTVGEMQGEFEHDVEMRKGEIEQDAKKRARQAKKLEKAAKKQAKKAAKQAAKQAKKAPKKAEKQAKNAAKKAEKSAYNGLVTTAAVTELVVDHTRQGVQNGKQFIQDQEGHAMQFAQHQRDQYQLGKEFGRQGRDARRPGRNAQSWS